MPDWDSCTCGHPHGGEPCDDRGCGCGHPNDEAPEKVLRRLLWLRHGCPVEALYGDDGEMQCSACFLDFKRMAPHEIEQAWEKKTKWRPLQDDEYPHQDNGHGQGVGRSGELCCPKFDTRAPYEMVWVEGLGRVAKQGPHVLLECGEILVCACGEVFKRNDTQYRAIA